MSERILPSRSTHQVLERHKGNLLMVDEDQDDLSYYSAILQQLGYEIRSHSSYFEAAVCLEREKFDLVIVGQGTPNFEGRAVLAKALERDSHAPVLVLTRFADPQCYLEAMQMGAFDYLEKPLPASELAALVARHLRPVC